MDKVYVIIGDWDYDGHDKPFEGKFFLSKVSAQDYYTFWCNQHDVYEHPKYDKYEIVELEYGG